MLAPSQVKQRAASKMQEGLLTPSLIRAARGLLGWSQTELAKKSGISRKAIATIETAVPSESIDPRRKKILQNLRSFLEDDCGMELVFESGKTGEGVRLRSRRTGKTDV
jgi:DNA-binding XRE family transcriptional regulator